jgi:hypothetical protein
MTRLLTHWPCQVVVPDRPGWARNPPDLAGRHSSLLSSPSTSIVTSTSLTPNFTAMAFPRDSPDLEKEMFLYGYTLEIFTLRRLQYLYDRDTRIYWNRVLSPELLEETMYYCDTDQTICEEVEYHLENGDFEFAFLRASGPRMRCKFAELLDFLCTTHLTTTPSQGTTCLHAPPCYQETIQKRSFNIPDSERIVTPNITRPHISDYGWDLFASPALAQG